MNDDESPETKPQRGRSFDESPALAAQAARFLCAPRTALPMTAEDAQLVVAHMRLVSFGAGTVLFREGDRSHSNYMLLLLEGEVSVDTMQFGAEHEAVPISVLGPGCIIGEMAMIDGGPRSATCTAATAVQAAGLSRLGLEKLLQHHPGAAARLLVVLAQFTADRLRAMSEQLQLYSQINEQLRLRLNLAPDV